MSNVVVYGIRGSINFEYIGNCTSRRYFILLFLISRRLARSTLVLGFRRHLCGSAVVKKCDRRISRIRTCGKHNGQYGNSLIAFSCFHFSYRYNNSDIIIIQSFNHYNVDEINLVIIFN